MRLRIAGLLIACICLVVGSTACVPLLGGVATPFDVPKALRSQAAREFPQFDVVAAEGSTMSSPEQPGWTEQDVELLLRHKKVLFFHEVEYDRNFKQGTTPPEWGLNTVGLNGDEGLDFRGEPDTRTTSFIAHFVQEYPHGEMVMQDSSFSTDPGTRQTLEAWITRRDDGVNGIGHRTKFVYDSNTDTWTGR